jgi:hypothetical protein
MKKLIFLLIIFMSANLIAQDQVILNSTDIIEGEILNDEFGAVKMVVTTDGVKDTIQILKTQIKKIVYSPDAVFDRPVTIAFAPALTFLGVRSQLNDVLVKNDFDGNYSSWLFGPTTSQFPKVTSFLSLALDGNWRVAQRYGFGLKFGVFNHILAKGYNYDKGGQVELNYLDVGLIPYVRWYNSNYKIHFDLGPSFNLISLKGEGTVPDVYQQGPEASNNLHLGLNVNAGVAIYEKSHSYLHLNFGYQKLFGMARLNPIYYKDSFEMTQMVIPMEEVRMSQFSIGLTYGRKFKEF